MNDGSPITSANRGRQAHARPIAANPEVLCIRRPRNGFRAGREIRAGDQPRAGSRLGREGDQRRRRPKAPPSQLGQNRGRLGCPLAVGYKSMGHSWSGVKQRPSRMPAGRGASRGTRGPGSAAARPKTRRENSLQRHDGLGQDGQGVKMCGPRQLDDDGRQNKTAKKHEAEQPHGIRDRSENEREIRTGKDRKHAENTNTAAKTGRTRQLGGPPGASITTKGGPHDCKTDRRSTRAGSRSSAARLLGPASF